MNATLNGRVGIGNGRHVAILLTIAAALVFTCLLPAIPQPLHYHQFADQRVFLSVPNAFDVLSNLPFAMVGAFGLAVTFSRRRPPLADRQERRPYAVLFGAVCVATLGSAYYHLAPSNARLVWDRLPMTIGFMSLLTIVVAERVSRHIAHVLFVPVVVFGALSVFYWYASELRGHGDLRWYLLVQFGSLGVIGVILLSYPARQPGGRYVVLALMTYGVAKVFELLDADLFAFGHIVSGHTLKHVVAALGIGCLVLMLRARTAGAGGVTERTA
jgi:hypothetical protein